MPPIVRPKMIALLGVLFAATALSGCATAVVGGITLGEISAAAGIASVGTTGKGLQDHALSAVTGRDCRLLEGIVRRGRRICEEPGSPATDDDFPGVVAMLRGGPDETDPDANPEVIYAGIASDTVPALARTERQSRAPSIEDLIAAEPVQLAGPLTAPIMPTARAPEAAILPTASEWASAQPAPGLIPARWSGR